MTFGFCEAIFGQTRDKPEESTVAHLVCHDRKYLAARLPAAGSLITVGKGLHQRHINSVLIRIFVTGELATEGV